MVFEIKIYDFGIAVTVVQEEEIKKLTIEENRANIYFYVYRRGFFKLKAIDLQEKKEEKPIEKVVVQYRTMDNNYYRGNYRGGYRGYRGGYRGSYRGRAYNPYRGYGNPRRQGFRGCYYLKINKKGAE